MIASTLAAYCYQVEIAVYLLPSLGSVDVADGMSSLRNRLAMNEGVVQQISSLLLLRNGSGAPVGLLSIMAKVKVSFSICLWVAAGLHINAPSCKVNDMTIIVATLKTWI